MTCYHPIVGYRSRAGRQENGAWPVVFNPAEGYIDMRVSVPCGRCIGCRLDRSRQWAVRCVHEAAQYGQNNCFITLTYNDENLPEDGGLRMEDFQKFMKRLRKEYGEGIRFFHCGEYGDKMARPHYHACLFNFKFPDLTLWLVRKGTKHYRSASLEKLWPYGHSLVGEVTFESAAYVARYITKKVMGKKAEEFYKGKAPEYITMSRRPGIGKNWIDKNMKDVYPLDAVVIREGFKAKPPRYYDYIYDIHDHDGMKKVKQKRRSKAKEDDVYRLEVKEKIQLIKAEKLIRPLERSDQNVEKSICS